MTIAYWIALFIFNMYIKILFSNIENPSRIFISKLINKNQTNLSHFFRKNYTNQIDLIDKKATKLKFTTHRNVRTQLSSSAHTHIQFSCVLRISFEKCNVVQLNRKRASLIKCVQPTDHRESKMLKFEWKQIFINKKSAIIN